MKKTRFPVISDRMAAFPEINEFLSFITSERGSALNTRMAYEQDLDQFAEYCIRKDKKPAELSIKDLRDYLAGLRKQGMAPRTVARKLSAIKQLYKFLMREDKLDQDPSELLSVTNKEKKLPPHLSVEQMLRLVESAEGKDDLEIRDRALLEIWYATGARVTEVAKLSIAGIDWTGGMVKILGKGGRERLVPLNDSAIIWCKKYQSVRHEWIRASGLKETDIFFLSRRGKGLTRQAIWRMLKRYAEKAGLERRVWPHLIRHSFATHVLQGGADLRAVQELLGHRSIATTEIYTHLDIENLKVMQLKYHPRS